MPEMREFVLDENGNPVLGPDGKPKTVLVGCYEEKKIITARERAYYQQKEKERQAEEREQRRLAGPQDEALYEVIRGRDGRWHRVLVGYGLDTTCYYMEPEQTTTTEKKSKTKKKGSTKKSAKKKPGATTCKGRKKKLTIEEYAMEAEKTERYDHYLRNDAGEIICAENGYSGEDEQECNPDYQPENE